MSKASVSRVFLVLVAVGGVLGYGAWQNAFYVTIERTDVHPSPDPLDDLTLVDDRLEDLHPDFDPQRVDRRDYEGWQINHSAAVIRLDCPDIRPDRETAMTRLYATYADAIRESQRSGLTVLPSANMLDGFAKQFDDGLYAALDLACFRGDAGFSPSAVDVVNDLFSALPARSQARGFLAAALQLADRPVPLDAHQQAAADAWLQEFQSDPSRSKPISFYTWNDDLRRVWKFFRFLQYRFDQDHVAVPREIADVLASDETLRREYLELVDFYSRLTNPPDGLNLSQLIGTDAELPELARRHHVQRPVVSVLPSSTSRETELFNRMFSSGTAAQTNLMVELIRRIRSGEVDLTPRQDSGWYDQQIHALETLLLPSRGKESQKLLLTAKYKRRLIQAFQALITKRRETHARQLGPADVTSALPPRKIRPRLRVEPCATFYLRTARSYAFLESFLHVNHEAELGQLHGWREEGQRETDLQSELASIKQLFYGFYLVACDDIGLAPELRDEEAVDVEDAYRSAEVWLADLTHRDLAVDTRVSVPILYDPIVDTTRLWGTLGVRMVKLNANYVRPPQMRENADSPWQPLGVDRLGDAKYVIAVDEFAEFSLPGRETLTRQQLRDLADRHHSKQAILEALSKSTTTQK
ncbi:hypothetical protein Enr13x_44670 [Stieleria neptunia]|uniref:Uncharacterized protein n=1 Tax=Stieleria neptunia TaxID=2527979 RepID=A0A518HUU2_9BACT|nr:hypothetical protein [Stieleria neptunia]QDV44599.1 hypothetical protein Enr13x_44670 [Stieleria neptunia]